MTFMYIIIAIIIAVRIKQFPTNYIWRNLAALSKTYTAKPLPEMTKGFPCGHILTGKTLFSLQGSSTPVESKWQSILMNSLYDWTLKSRIRRIDRIFPQDWGATSWGKYNLTWFVSGLATSDKGGILPILSSYPSFNNIPDRKVTTCKENFSNVPCKFSTIQQFFQDCEDWYFVTKIVLTYCEKKLF